MLVDLPPFVLRDDRSSAPTPVGPASCLGIKPVMASSIATLFGRVSKP